MAGKNNLESVDINKDASVQGLFEDLEKLAKSRATKVSKIAAKIYIYAVNNRPAFRPPLNEPRSNPGKFISSKVPISVKDELKKWAAEQGATRNSWCCFILQKAFENGNIEKIIDSN